MDTLFADQHVELLPPRTTLKRGRGRGGNNVAVNVAVVIIKGDFNTVIIDQSR
ncbi:hypothetical protein [Geodermatophilus sp. URMC 64]